MDMILPKPTMRSNSEKLKAPFPYFGGKSKVADLVWPRLSPAHSPARNYIEPFCGSLAMLLLRPDEPKIETVNDIHHFIANAWRAIQKDPEGVARWADGPVNEDDLHSRHRWLTQSRKARIAMARVRAEPEYFNAKIAGWWIHGACMWIGSGWCDSAELRTDGTPREKTPANVGEYGSMRGVLKKTPDMDGGKRSAVALHNKRPCFPDGSSVGRGVQGFDANRPQLADAYSRGRGVHGNDELSDCERRRLWLTAWMLRLADRLRAVRVCCGHWDRVCDSDSTLTRLGTTAVFLDPPYRKKLADGTTNRASHIYANDKAQDVDALVDEVQAWCLKWGGNKDIRIAVCGLEGEYPDLDAAGWEKLSWRSQGGYGNRNKENTNAERERIWFSPHCVSPVKPRTLFDK